MTIPKRFFYAAVLPFGGFIAFIVVSAYFFGVSFQEADFSFWENFGLVVVNIYAVFYLPLSLYFCRKIRVLRLLYIVYVVLAALIHMVYVGVLLNNLWFLAGVYILHDGNFHGWLFPNIGIVIGVTLLICLLSMIIPALTVFRPIFLKKAKNLKNNLC